jgi:hypothetical protein
VGEAAKQSPAPVQFAMLVRRKSAKRPRSNLKKFSAKVASTASISLNQLGVAAFTAA